ncbi:EAL domain-containing protein [Vibrio sp. SCSIO 43135]|uniref:EAL domain-containing protein n=1 Tax=Vibrio sp. SCSIO 43135 TaxID=2819096 RepID=UPI002076168A|nr:EAL domain-containing protein [Vibrio sp. SCSIO 43135]USD41111.1 EAL domain-containing protein [Vibrio sp. SCSIO 43135]
MRFIFILFASLISFSGFAQEKDVLVVHSYHQGFFWTDAFQKGLENVLSEQDVSTRVVYLDTKRLQSPEYLEQLYQLYKTKFEQEQYRAVVVSDNNALDLMKRLAPQLGDTLVVFGGINDYQPALHAGLKATGVNEDTDILSNITLIKKLQPNVKKVYVVSDHSVTGKAVRQQVTKFLNSHPSYQSLIENYTPTTYQQLKTWVGQIDSEESVLFWVYYRDENGWVVNDKVWQSFNEYASAPVYMVHDLGLGNGAVGGVIQSGKQQGRETAQVLIKALNNPDKPLPKVKVGTPEIKLDYQALEHWGLGVDNVADAVLFNKPKTFAERYQQELKWLAAIISIFSAIIFFLVYYLRKLKVSQQAAINSQVLLESVFDQTYQYIGILDQFGRIQSNNSKLQELLYDKHYQLNKPIWQHKHWHRDSSEQIEAFFNPDNNDSASVSQFEGEFWHREQGSMVLEITLKQMQIKSDREHQYLFEARDITSRKITEDKLFQREAKLSHYYDQQPVMMITLDEYNRIQQVNRFAEQLLGHRSGDLLGRKLKEFYTHKESIEPRQVLLQPKQVMKGVWRREIEYRHHDGHAVWVRENIRPMVESGSILIVGEDVSQNRKLEAQLEYQARYDLLTDTYNRNYFELELDKALKETQSHMRTHAMLYLDMDQLKVLNDTAGHEAGDAAIQFCASMLEEILPYKALLARMGGDEFSILLKDCTENDAVRLAKQIITTLSEQAFLWDDIRLNLTCSIGIRLIDHTASSPQMVHAQADTACHAAKEEGRNRFNLYCPDDADLQRREREMESVNLVHDALAHDRIELFAQRILDLSEQQANMHFEILVRIRNPKGEYISPGIFMPASERYNIAHLIDKQVVTKTLHWLEANPNSLEQLSRCSINLSGHSMGNREFIRFLLHTLETSPVPCEKICLEITETAAMSNMNQAIELFTQLKQLGCVIALDDFGSGLSSFGYLKKLPVDVVKIDGIFVRDIDVNEMDYIMVRAINDLAQQMGKKTVAEFVENTQIIDKLQELGVNYAQGYIIGKPKPLAELVAELEGEASRA